MRFGTEILFVLLSLIVYFIDAKPHKDRVHDKDVSDVPHSFEGQHNSEYDHQAFLGKTGAKRFDQLTPEESKARLSIIVDKIDVNNDGKVTADELRNWIKLSSKRYLVEDRDRSWKDMSLGDDDKLTWELYFNTVISHPDDEDDDESLKDVIEKDKNRWKVADENNDGVLDKNEYLDFLHPEDSPRMRHVVIDETLLDLDTNKDGYIDRDEYIHDMWHGEPSETEPEWVKAERETFNTKRDRNGDGKLDREEVDEWILPKDFDHVESETKHLISSADANLDGYLTKEEILERFDLFVGSQATDFGEALSIHDEL